MKAEEKAPTAYKIVCVGKNFAEHAAEMASAPPELPLLFLKPNTAVIGPGDPIIVPQYTNELSLEAEIAVVLKRVAKNVPADAAHQFILGYTCANDLTARDSQRQEQQWFRAKAFDTSCPLGPWIETDLDAASVTISSAVDGEVKQHASSALMIHSIPHLIQEISSVVTLLPGDVVLTGTPAGVATVHPGATVEVSVEGIGTLTNRVMSARDMLD